MLSIALKNLINEPLVFLTATCSMFLSLQAYEWSDQLGFVTSHCEPKSLNSVFKRCYLISYLISNQPIKPETLLAQLKGFKMIVMLRK